ncbi:MAG: thioredoxin family protein [Rhodomicrobium sp.]
MTQTGKKSPLRLSRRSFLTAAGASLVAGLPAAHAAPQLQLDGLYGEPWILKASGNLAGDFAAAAKAKKNFALLWEMRGCPWCKRLHLEVFSRDDVADYLRDNFNIVQLNLRGRGEIAGFNGDKLSEEELSFELDVNSTPTFQFFRPGDAAKALELGRAGFLSPGDLLMLAHFIRERGYEKGSYDEWARSHKNPA